MPFEAWLRGPLGEVLRDTLDPAVARRRGLLDPAGVVTVRDRFLRGQMSWAEPWLLMMLELWCREVLDTAGRAISRPGVEAPNATPSASGLAPLAAGGGR